MLSRSLCLGLPLLALCWSAPALAQSRDTSGDSAFTGPRDQSPQHAAFELRFGRYVPQVDENVPSGTPFRDFFGTTDRFLIGFEIDWQALRIPHFGSFGPGFGFGYTRMSATNRLPEGSADVDADVSQSSTLNIMPMYLVGVLRVDALMRDLKVPIVPYAKLGFGWALWWVNDGIGIARSDDTGLKGSDISFGPQWALGGMLLLDGIDQGSAKALDNEAGVNNAYLFGEWYNSELGSDSRMEVGTSTWMVGFALEM
jgi:hypothetical protein